MGGIRIEILLGMAGERFHRVLGIRRSRRSADLRRREERAESGYRIRSQRYFGDWPCWAWACNQQQDFIPHAKSIWEASEEHQSWGWRQERGEGDGQWVWLLSLRPTGERTNLCPSRSLNLGPLTWQSSTQGLDPCASPQYDGILIL